MPMVRPISSGMATANVTGSGSLGGDGRGTATAVAGAATAVGAGGLAASARGLPSGPVVRSMREQLGDQSIAGGGGQVRPGLTPAGQRIGRNDACWCGSGAKYKKCHGK